MLGTLHCNAAHIVSGTDEEVMNLLLTKSGIELGRRICDPEDALTSLALVEACIVQIKRANPYLNAVVATRFTLARQEARSADLAVTRGRVDPAHVFHGVPCVVKECFELPGMPYTAGVAGRRGILGSGTAPALQELQLRGVVVLASTNLSEGCMWHESFNTIYGRSFNPYDFGRTPGGSSGGCGAAVAACFAPLAVTSDVGGSTRIPALYNGVFGHKPTGGSISNDGTIPAVGVGEVREYCQLGPMSRHADDLWPLLRHMLQQNDGHVTVLQRDNVDAVAQVSLADLTVGFSTRSLGHQLLLSPLHPEVSTGIHAAVAHLTDVCGCQLGDGFDSIAPEVHEYLNAFQTWGALMSRAKQEPFSVTIREHMNPFWGLLGISVEFLWSVIELSPHTLPALLLSAAEYAVSLTPAQNEQFCAFGARIRSVLEEKLCQDYVLIIPSVPTPALLHNESLIRIFDTANTSFFNVMELPSTAVPFGLSAEGLPIGCQIVAGRGQDHLCIAVATELERVGLAKWVAPRSYIHS